MTVHREARTLVTRMHGNTRETGVCSARIRHAHKKRRVTLSLDLTALSHRIFTGETTGRPRRQSVAALASSRRMTCTYLQTFRRDWTGLNWRLARRFPLALPSHLISVNCGLPQGCVGTFLLRFVGLVLWWMNDCLPERIGCGRDWVTL